MPERRLRTVPYRPDPKRNNVIDCRPGHEGPYLSGDGPVDTVCGACGAMLIRGILAAYITLYICCPGCGTFNVAEPHAGPTA